MDTPAFIIENEQQFYEMIAELTHSDKIDEASFSLPDIEFKGFPTLKFNVKGVHYSATLTSFLLKALSSMTTEIQKSYCLVKYHTANLQKLTIEDYENIDIIFKIQEGSSEGESDNSAIARGILSVIERGMEGMNGWQKLAVLVAMISVLGGLGWKYLDNQESENKSTTHITETAIKEVSSIAKHSLAMVNEKGRNQISEEIEAHNELAKNNFFKEIAKDNSATSAELNGDLANREQLNEYKKRSSISREKKTRTHNFIIKGIEFYNPTYVSTDVTIYVIRIQDDEEFSLKTSLNLMSDDEVSKLKSALGTNENISITYEEIKENGKIVQSQFVRIEDVNSIQ